MWGTGGGGGDLCTLLLGRPKLPILTTKKARPNLSPNYYIGKIRGGEHSAPPPPPRSHMPICLQQMLKIRPHFLQICYESNSAGMATTLTTAGILLPDWLKH